MPKQVFSGVTLKSFIVGIVCSFLIAVGTPYSDMITKTAGMATDAFTPGAIFLLFVLVGGINVLLKAMERGFRDDIRLSLARSELVVVYVMMIVACAIPTMGLSESFFPLLTGAFYYATPENEWAELIHPYIKPWMVPQSKEAHLGVLRGPTQGRTGAVGGVGPSSALLVCVAPDVVLCEHLYDGYPAQAVGGTRATALPLGAVAPGDVGRG